MRLVERQYAESDRRALLAALRSGQLGMLTIRVPDAGLSFETTRADLRRFWRRPLALAGHAPR